MSNAGRQMEKRMPPVMNSRSILLNNSLTRISHVKYTCTSLCYLVRITTQLQNVCYQNDRLRQNTARTAECNLDECFHGDDYGSMCIVAPSINASQLGYILVASDSTIIMAMTCRRWNQVEHGERLRIQLNAGMRILRCVLLTLVPRDSETEWEWLRG